jgi:hypothetical protein
MEQADRLLAAARHLPARQFRARELAVACAAATILAVAAPARACDGKSYSVTIATGATADGGGLVIRLDKAKFIDDRPDKYYISVKDDGTVLGDHVLLIQNDTVNFKTRCGTVSIGANRKSMFSNGTLTLNWSYF